MAVRRIGLTGGIGSGKSTVATLWVARGAALVDADAIARSITAAGGRAIDAVRREFGEAVIDPSGALHRERMRELAFNDPLSKQRLEGLLHPLIGEEALAQAAASSSEVVVFDVPLMGAASPWRTRCDRILVVDCSEATQIERVVRRSGWSAEQVLRVIAQQTPRPTRRAIADAVIDNDGPRTLDALDAAVQALWALWVKGRSP